MAADPDPHVVCLAGPQTIREAAQTHAVLLEALRDHAEVALDCSGVGEVDLSFVQMILAARRSADAGGRGAGGRGFALLRPPEGALREALVRGGLLSGDAGAPEADPGLWTRGEAGA